MQTYLPEVTQLVTMEAGLEARQTSYIWSPSLAFLLRPTHPLLFILKTQSQIKQTNCKFVKCLVSHLCPLCYLNSDQNVCSVAPRRAVHPNGVTESDSFLYLYVYMFIASKVDFRKHHGRISSLRKCKEHTRHSARHKIDAQ